MPWTHLLERSGLPNAIPVRSSEILESVTFATLCCAPSPRDGRKQTRCTADVITYNGAISACAKADQTMIALQLLQLMARAQISPTVISYSSATRMTRGETSRIWKDGGCAQGTWHNILAAYSNNILYAMLKFVNDSLMILMVMLMTCLSGLGLPTASLNTLN